MAGINHLEQSQEVLHHALRLAQFHQARLTVAYVLDFGQNEVRNLHVPEGIDKKEIFENFRQEKHSEVKTFVNRFYTKQYHDIPLTIEVKFGYTHEALCGLVEEYKAELLVIGKFTHAGNLFFSDASDKFINWSPCPLYIVPEGVEFHAFKRIIYASNLVLEDCENLFYLIPWLKIFDTTLICLHVSQNKEEEEISKRKIDILNRLFPQDNITFRSVIAPVEKGIERYAQLSKSDMVATMHRSRKQWVWNHFFRTKVSKTIAEDLKIPMIVFQQK